jgi:mannosyltransferase
MEATCMGTRVSQSGQQSWLVLVAVIMLGAWFRLHGLAVQSLWNDELASVVYTNLPPIDMIRATARDVHPPAYYLILWASRNVLGDSEIMLRMPSAFAGILAIAAMYVLGRRVYSAREGILGATLLAALWSPIYYSQEARMYSFVLLFTLVTSALWIGLVKRLSSNRMPWRLAAAYILASCILLYLHYYGIFVSGLQGGAFFLLGLRHVRRLRSILLVYLLVVLAYAPWMMFVLPGWQYQKGASLGLRAQVFHRRAYTAKGRA